MFGILIGIFVLVVLVALHELGHAIVAKRNGVKVKEFGIGFPPAAKSKIVKNSFLGKNVKFSLNWLPLGGFVQLQGEYDSSNKKGDYGAAGYWSKTKILFAGVAVNFLIAAVLFSVLALVGLPKILPNQFMIKSDSRVETRQQSQVVATKIQKDTAAEEAGLKSGDQIKAIDGKKIQTSQELINIIKKNPDHKLNFSNNRSGKDMNISVKPARKNNHEGFLGAQIGQTAARQTIHSTWSAPIVGVGTTVQFTAVTLNGLGEMLVNLGKGLVQSVSFDAGTRTSGGEKIETVSQNVAGPIGILGIIFPESAKSGFSAVLFMSAIISLSLAVMNALPIPALDGGRWFVMTIYRLRRKVLTKEKEEKIQSYGMMFILLLVVLTTFSDVGKIIK